MVLEVFGKVADGCGQRQAEQRSLAPRDVVETLDAEVTGGAEELVEG